MLPSGKASAEDIKAEAHRLFCWGENILAEQMLEGLLVSERNYIKHLEKNPLFTDERYSV
jgi:hypothetical protein